MTTPFFYSQNISLNDNKHVLNADTSKHIVQVLRMKEGEELKVTNGKGYVFSALVIDSLKKGVVIKIIDTNFNKVLNKISIGISLVKNTARFEWFLEKATETGVTHIIPLICKRTEKQHFRMDRMNNIMVSAMLQSQQAHLPQLHEPIKFEPFLNSHTSRQKFIAHCDKELERRSVISYLPFSDPLILIGPEGDFTAEEIAFAIQHKFQPVSLGNSRLRTETAGMVAATLLRNY